METNTRTRIRAVRAYLRGKTLREVSVKYNIHINTLSRWLKRYRHGGASSLRTLAYAKPWNRSSKGLEQRVVLLKEAEPSLTIRNARMRLMNDGLRLSIKGIYGIWKRFNLLKRPISDPNSPFGPLSREARNMLQEIKVLLRKPGNKGALKKAAAIVNSIPVYPKNYEAVLNMIPDRLLSPRRQLDKLYPMFMKTPMPEFAKKMKKVRLQLETKGFRYSSIIAGLNEIIALHWMRTPKEELRLHAHLRRQAGKFRDPVLNFQLSFMPATAWVELGNMKKAHELLKRSRRLLCFLPHGSFYESYGDLMTFIGDYRTAQGFHFRALKMRRERIDQVRLRTKIILNHVISGEYLDALRFSSTVKIEPQSEYYMEYTAGQGFLYYGLGQFEKALLYVRETLARAEKEQFRNTLYSAVIVLTSTARALEKFREAKNILSKYLHLIEKYRLKREGALLRFLLEGELPSKQLARFPIFRLLFLLKKAQTFLRAKDYRRAFFYANKKGLMGFFHRYVVFYPEVVLNLLRKGNKTGLPNAILCFPVFNKEVPAYYIKFLGRMILARRQKRLKVKLTPKEEALLIHLALKVGEPGRSVPVHELYTNFWPRSRNPASQLSHLLVRLKTKLLITKHLISISIQSDERRLVNRGFYMASDYQDLETTLAEAKALERANEWSYARVKYLQAFRFVRGEPFKRMYDPWSENTRMIIFNQLETAGKDFAQGCVEHKNKKEATRILKKVSWLINPSYPAQTV